MEANQPPGMRTMPTGEVQERHDQTGHPAPAVAELEELQPVDALDEPLTWHTWTEDDGKYTGSAGEIPFPLEVSRAGGESGMQDGFDVLSVCQPARDGEATGLELLQAHGQGLHASQRQRAIVGGYRKPEQLMRIADCLVEARITQRDRPEQDVTVTADVLRERLHRYVHAMPECIEEDTRRVGIVQRQGNPPLAGRRRDGRHVLDF